MLFALLVNSVVVFAADLLLDLWPALPDWLGDWLPLRGVLPAIYASLFWLARWPSITELVQVLVLLPLLVVPKALRKYLDDALSYALRQLGALFPWLIPPTAREGKAWINMLAAMPDELPASGFPPRSAYDPPPTFPTLTPGSPENGAVLAWCSMAAYDSWLSLDRLLTTSYPNGDVEFVRAWNFRHRPCSASASARSAARCMRNCITNTSATTVLASAEALHGVVRSQAPVIDTGAFLVRFRGFAGGRDALVLSFTGSEPLESADWLTNLIGVAAPDTDAPDWPYGFYHRGFMNALGLGMDLEKDPAAFERKQYWEFKHNARFRELLPDHPDATPFGIVLEEVYQQLLQHKSADLYVTGHSLGAALAALFAAAVLVPTAVRSQAVERGLVRARFGALITFAQPRVGGYRFSFLLQQALNGNGAQPRYIRVVNTSDIVPRVPPPIARRYNHAGQLMIIKPSFLAATPSAAGMPCAAVAPAATGALQSGATPNAAATAAATTTATAAPGALAAVMALPAPFWKLLEQMNIYYLQCLTDNTIKLAHAVLALPALSWLRDTLADRGIVPRYGTPQHIGLHVLTRIGALPPGGLLLTLAFAVVFAILAKFATLFTLGLYLLVLPLDVLLFLVWALYAWPVLASGVVDHNMLDYYVAMVSSVQDDWVPGSTTRSS